MQILSDYFINNMICVLKGKKTFEIKTSHVKLGYVSNYNLLEKRQSFFEVLKRVFSARPVV